MFNVTEHWYDLVNFIGCKFEQLTCQAVSFLIE